METTNHSDEVCRITPEDFQCICRLRFRCLQFQFRAQLLFYIVLFVIFYISTRLCFPGADW